ncbi:hypothetical protein [Streptomyces sp. NPDC050535]|uniref:hypothetical protein n=1 Tax=Streptomyces sp. NPDC050535 TaxID=3365626 RepID=UPI0037BC739C
MRRTEAMKIISRVLRQPSKDMAQADIIYGYPISFVQGAAEGPRPWGMETSMLALRIAAELPLTDEADQPLSPLAQAEDAKRRRDIVGELAALSQGDAALTSAPWYPLRPGDLVHVAYEQAGQMAAFGETYLVGDAGDGLLSMQLLAHTCPDAEPDGMVGCFAVESADCPVYEAWFEAGPQRLTIVRDGRPVHIGGAR